MVSRYHHAVEMKIAGIMLAQTAPREMHRLVTRELTRALAFSLEEKIASGYGSITTHSVPLDPYERHSDYKKFGLDLIVMTQAEFKQEVQQHAQELLRKAAA